MPSKEIRIHGRGGQGAVTSSQVLAIAAFNSGKYCQSFPSFGVERRGAPVEAFARVSDEQINVRQHVYTPDCVIVLDPTLTEAVQLEKGLKDDGVMIINSNKTAEELGFDTKATVKSIDVTKIALEVIGKPFVNIAVLGAYAAITGDITLEGINKAIDQEFSHKPKIGELNKAAAKKLFEIAKGE